MSSFWSLWIIGLTVVTLLGTLWLLLANRKTQQHGDHPQGEGNKTGHEYDGIEEYDNPLPAWWMNMFLLSILFSVFYLVAYPGLGNFKGMLGWTQEKQYDREMHNADARFLAVYHQLGDTGNIAGLASNEKAVKMGQRLFSTNCTVCHGADAGGTRGYPNLRDGDWLYGGEPEAIKASIANGRQGMMPAWGPVFGSDAAGEEKIHQVALYVKALSEQKQDNLSVAAGKEIFATYCAACHGAGGEGNTVLGAPRLNDRTWLYGGNIDAIERSIRNGLRGQMPAHHELLGEERIQLIAAYVYSLSHASAIDSSRD